MKSNEVPAWANTTSVDLAAAVSVLGIPIALDQSTDAISGQGWKTFLLGLESVPHRDIGMKADKSELPTYKTQTVVGMLRKGMLAKKDPHHPCLDVLRACVARETLIHALKTGSRYRLAKVQTAERYQLVPGEEPESVKAAASALMTRDLKMAACLTVLGCPLLKIAGPAGSSEFFFGSVGYGFPRPIPADLSQAYRTKRLAESSPEHPLLWMMQGLSNRDALCDLLRTGAKMVLVRAPGTGRASIVSEKASGRTMDRVRKHLRIV